MSVAEGANNILQMNHEIIFAILLMSGWGGIVRYIMLRVNRGLMQDIISCLLQIIVSCFCGAMLSIILINKNISDNRVLVFAGLGGVFSGPILNILGKKIADWVDHFPPGSK